MDDVMYKIPSLYAASLPPGRNYNYTFYICDDYCTVL